MTRSPKYKKSKRTSREESKAVSRKILEHVEQVIEESKQIRQDTQRAIKLLQQTIKQLEIQLV